MTTLRNLINGSHRLINTIQQGESLTADDMQVSLESLSGMIQSWSNDRLMVYSVTEYVFPITGKQSYTLGLGGDWDVPRPMKVEEAYARLQPNSPQQLDIAMQPLTVAQWSGIAVKNTPSTFPFAFYDDRSYPLRTINLFPIPNGPCDVVLWLQEPIIDLEIQSIGFYTITNNGTLYTDGFYPDVTLGAGTGTGATANITILNGAVLSCVLTSGGSGYSVNDLLNISSVQVGGTGSGFQVRVDLVSGNLDSPIDFPPGYERAFRYNLALELAPEFGKTPDPIVVARADKALEEIKNLNSVPQYIRGDGGMSRSGRNRYFNWITGNFWSFGNN